jgi:soluble lytic murein transglycosylase-like protein
MVPPHVEACRDRVNDQIATAAQVAAAHTPAWERDARSVLAEEPDYAERLISAIRDAASASGVAADTLWGVAYTESRGRHWRSSGRIKRGGAGEIGLMQVLPFWQKALKRTVGLDVDLDRLEDNVLAGAFILRRGGDETPVMLSYYNTGQRISSTRYQRRVMNYISSFQ